MRPALSLRDLIDLESQLAADAELDPVALRQRDRRIGLALSEELADIAPHTRALFLAWLRHLRREGISLPGEQAVHARTTLSLLLALLGLALGAGAVLGIFGAGGQHPVNIAHVLGVFVFLQLILLLLFAISALPGNWIRSFPGATSLQTSLRLLAPGRLATPLARILPQEARDALDAATGRLRSFERCYTSIRSWALIELGQSFALSFQVAALVTALSLITFTDLAFGWSTTLDLGAASFHRLTELLAAPWSSIFPEAAPSLALIEATRYFHFEGNFAEAEMRSGGSGQWWPFVILCMLCYGFIPRLFAWGLARWRLGAALNEAPLDHAEFERLYERLTEPLVETQASGHTPDASGASAGNNLTDMGIPFRDAAGTARDALAIDWGGIGIPEENLRAALSRRFHLELRTILPAGRLDLDADRAALEACADGELPVLLTKAYEPPTRDVLGFLEALRGSVGDGTMIYVLPLERDAEGGPAAPNPEDFAQWRHRLLAQGDPWLRVESLGESE